jgi:hypothetical protein
VTVKGKIMQQVIDVAMAVLAIGVLSAAVAFCARVGWEFGGRL